MCPCECREAIPQIATAAPRNDTACRIAAHPCARTV